jgi:hypothetical protein
MNFLVYFILIIQDGVALYGICNLRKLLGKVKENFLNWKIIYCRNHIFKGHGIAF